MNHIRIYILLLGLWFGRAGSNAVAQESDRIADSVRSEFLHAWNGYKQYAWGHDALKPLSREPHDWYRSSLLMTPVDAYDALRIMHLDSAASEAKELILDSLTFDKDMEVQSFEITIRLLGGLLASYQIDGDRRFLRLAEDLGNRLLPVYGSSTGMPYRYVNLRTGKIRDSLNNPAEIGTALIEFGTLSKLTGNLLFYEKPKNALVQVYRRRSTIGLLGSTINVETGNWVDSASHIGGGIDSYFEYLVKAWRLFGDTDCEHMWDNLSTALDRYLADTTFGGLWYGEGNMRTGKIMGTTFGALQAFFPAVLCLANDVGRARLLEQSCYRMWNRYGIEPEEINYATMTATAKEYYLRPEIIESAYYLWHYTGDTLYRTMGRTFFDDLRRYCRTAVAYTRLDDVITKEKADGMDSFFLAETLKYLYLLFAPDGTLPFNEITFNTEAHPIRKTWK
jgi:mannosidase alpha-like ER degradation enhancer 2